MKTTVIKIFVPGLIVLALGFVGCESDDDEESPTGPGAVSDDFMSLAMGSYWVTENTGYLNDVLDSTWIDTFRIDTTFTHDEFSWYGDRNSPLSYRLDEDGVWERQAYPNSPIIISYQIYHANAQEGDEWPVPVGDNLLSSFTAVSVTESVTVTAGTFTGCHHYYMVAAHDDKEFTNEIWFKAGIGFVQRFLEYNTPQERRSLESKLKAYSVQ